MKKYMVPAILTIAILAISLGTASAQPTGAVKTKFYETQNVLFHGTGTAISGDPSDLVH